MTTARNGEFYPTLARQVAMTDDDWRHWRDWRQDRDILRPQSKPVGDDTAADSALEHDPPLAKAVELLKSELKDDAAASADSR